MQRHVNRKTALVLVTTVLIVSVPMPAVAQLGGLLRDVGRAAGRAAASQVLPRLIAAAIESASDNVQDADPFVFAVVDFIEGRDEQSANNFVIGLINNDINDHDTAERIINAVTGMSVTGGIAAALAGDTDTAMRLVAFGAYVRGSPYYSRWRQAVAQGHTVRVEGGVMVIREHPDGAPLGQDDAPAAAKATPSRPNEVVPFLNLVHGTPGARIYLDGEFFAESPRDEYMFDRLPAGTRDITIRDDYSEVTVTVFVNPGRDAPGGYDEMSVELERGRFHLSVDPDLAGLRVFVDDSEVGVTPIEDLEMDAGQRVVRLESEWNDPVSFEVDGRAGESVLLDAAIAARGGYRLSTLLPGDVRVTVAGQDVPLDSSVRYLDPGTYPVTIDGERMYPYSGAIEIRPAQNIVFDPEIRYRTGEVILDPMPQGARIILDGIPLVDEIEPEDILSELVIGYHEVTISTAEGDIVQHVFELEEFETLLLPVPVGTLEVSNVPEDGRFRLAGSEEGDLYGEFVSPGLYRIPDVLAGEHRFELFGPDIVPEEVSFSLAPEGNANATVRAMRYGSLVLSTDRAADLEVLDGNRRTVYRSSSRLSGHRERLPQGRYLVRAMLEDDQDWGVMEAIDVPPRAQNNLDLQVDYSLPYQIEMTTLELAEAERTARRKGRRRVTSMVAGGLTVAAAVATEVFASNVLESYSTYNRATTSSEAGAARREVEENSLYMYTSLAVAGGVGLVGGITYLTSLGLQDSRRNVITLERELEHLNARYAEEQARRALIALEAGQ